MSTKKNLFRRVNKKSNKLNKYLKLHGGETKGDGEEANPPSTPSKIMTEIDKLLEVPSTHIEDSTNPEDDEYADYSTQLTVSDIHMNYIVSNMYVNDFLNCDMEEEDEIYRTIKLLTKYPPDKKNGGFTYQEYCIAREYKSIFDEEKFIEEDSNSILANHEETLSINEKQIEIPNSFPQDIIYLTGWFYGEFMCDVILLLAELHVNKPYIMPTIDKRINRLMNSFYNAFGIEYIVLHNMDDTKYNNFFDNLLRQFEQNYKSLEKMIGPLVNLENLNLIYSILNKTQKYVYSGGVCEPLLEPWDDKDELLFDIVAVEDDVDLPDIPTIHKLFLKKSNNTWGNKYEINIYKSDYNIDKDPITESLTPQHTITFDIKTVFKDGILSEYITKAMSDEKEEAEKELALANLDVGLGGGDRTKSLKGGDGEAAITIKECLPTKKLLYGDNKGEVTALDKDLDGGKHDVLNRHMLYDGTHDFHTDLKNFTESNNVLPGNFMNAKRKSTTTKCNEALYMYKCLHGEDGYCINNNVPIENGLRVFFDNDFKDKSDDDNLVNMIGTFDMGTHADKSKSFNGQKHGIFTKDENGKFTEEAFVSVAKVWDSSTGEQITDIYKGDKVEDNDPKCTLSKQAHNLISLYLFWKYWIKQYNIEYYLKKNCTRIPFLNVDLRANSKQEEEEKVKGKKSKLAAYFSVLDFSGGGGEVNGKNLSDILTEYGLKSDNKGVSLAIDIKEIMIKKKGNSSKQLFNQKLTKQKCWIEFTSWLTKHLKKIRIIKTGKLAKKINVDRIINIILFCVNQINDIEKNIGLRFACKKRGDGGDSIDDGIFSYLNTVIGKSNDDLPDVFTTENGGKIDITTNKKKYIQKYILIIIVCLIIKHSGDTTQTYLSDICDTFSYSEDQMFICSALLDNNKLITCNQLKRKKDDRSKWPFIKTATTAQETIPIFKDKLGNDTGNINYTMTYQIKSELFEDYLVVQCTTTSDPEPNSVVKEINILNYITGESDSKFELKSNGYIKFANAVLEYWKKETNVIFNALDISIQKIINSFANSNSNKISIFNHEDNPFYVINNTKNELSTSQIDDIYEEFKSDKTKSEVIQFKLNVNKIEKLVVDEDVGVEQGTIDCYPLNEKAFKKLFQINNKYSTNNILPFNFSFLKTFKKGNIHTINFKPNEKNDKLTQILKDPFKVDEEIATSVGRKKKKPTELKITNRAVGEDETDVINNFDDLNINEYFSYVVSKIVISSIKRTVAINTYCDSNLFVLMEKLIISYTSNIQIYNELHLDKDLKPPDGDESNFYSECKKIVDIINTKSTGKIYPIHLFFKEIEKFDVTETNVKTILDDTLIKTWRNDDSSDPSKPKYWTVETIVNEFNDIKNTVIEFKKIICVINNANENSGNQLTIDDIGDVAENNNSLDVIKKQIVNHEIKKKVISIIQDTGTMVATGDPISLPPNTPSLTVDPDTQSSPDLQQSVNDVLISEEMIKINQGNVDVVNTSLETITEIKEENEASDAADIQVKEPINYPLFEQLHENINDPDPDSMTKTEIKDYLTEYSWLEIYNKLYPDDILTV